MQTVPTTHEENAAQLSKRITAAALELFTGAPAHVLIKHVTAMLTAYVSAKHKEGFPEYSQAETSDAALTTQLLATFAVEVQDAINTNEVNGYEIESRATRKALFDKKDK